MHMNWLDYNWRVFGVLALGLLLFSGPPAFAQEINRSKLQGAHGDRSVLPKTCRACHRGMSMKISGEETVCLLCHGDSNNRQFVISRGYLRSTLGGALADIGDQLRKPYNHPVLSSRGVHRQLEMLPEEVSNAARHSECVDCHEPHVVEKDRPFRGIPGRRIGNFMADIDKEYELCYKCHSSSANLPSNATNKHAEFKTTNPSFHPVEGEGRSQYVISLKEPYNEREDKPGDVSVITCGSCHGNDDPSGPRGPHGSNYAGLLVQNYEMEDLRPESPYAYALCYNCHDRASILGNESFAYHALHILGNPATNELGTSCFVCHDAHGSTKYQHLIRFDEDVVSPNEDDKLEYRATGVASRHGACLLNCHDVEHNPKSY
jgi:hypothetical protein